MKRTRYWIAFAVGALLVVAGMTRVTRHALELESAERTLRIESDRKDRVRLALWRMDSWLNTQLAPEAARPHVDYQAFHAQELAYTRSLGAIQPGEVLTRSPLLGYRSELFPLHFQLGAGNVLSSPQVPTGNERDLAEGTALAPAGIRDHASRLERLAGVIRYDDLAQRLGFVARLPMNCAPSAESTPWVAAERDLQNRFQQSISAKNAYSAPIGVNATEIAVGGLLPVWLDPTTPGGEGALVFARRVDLPAGTVYQGFTVDWSRLRAVLGEQVRDLFEPERIELVRQDVPDDASRHRMLATVPARLDVAPSATPSGAWSTTHGVLLAAWIALLLAIGSVGFALASALSFGDRRARFASALTHELRSPLTTFRMYSEMLAEDMVRDPAKRADYLATLCRESDRLARLVENVLAYSRVEEGRHVARPRRTTLGALIADIEPAVARRAEAAGLTLRVDVRDPASVLKVDPEAVEQVVFGLCDNACKYATDGTERTLELTAARRGAGVEIRVRDHGDGIPAEQRRRVFRPFDRGARQTGESMIPGVGLGLALARGLARRLGGELELDTRVSDGACFVLRLPVTDPGSA